jgi:AraC-like DNA-binding protein
MTAHARKKNKKKDDIPVLRNRLLLSTSMVEAKVRNDFWRSSLLPFFEPVLIEDYGETVFNGTISACSVGRLTLGQASFNAQKAVYSKRQALETGFDGFLLQVFKTGSLAGNYAGNTVLVKPGDIIVRDIQRPATSQVTNGTTHTVFIPRNLLKDEVESQLHGTVMRAHSPETRLLRDFILSVDDIAEQFCPTSSAQIEEAFVYLFSASILKTNQPKEEDNSATSLVLRQRILNFINKNLNNPELDVSMLLNHLHVSRAHLYRVLKHDGGVSKLIQSRRLDAAYKTLANPSFHRQSVEEIAYSFGFSNSTQFRRAFRSRFDCNPSALRRKKERDSENTFVQTNDAFEHFERVAKQYSLIFD